MNLYDLKSEMFSVLSIRE